MEITFLWSWLSFWIGFASVFMLVILLAIVMAVVQNAKRKKPVDSMGLEEWASKFK